MPPPPGHPTDTAHSGEGDDATNTDTHNTTTTIHSDLALRVGDRFASYDLLEQRLSRHSAADFVTYWRRDTRTVRGALMKTSRPIAARLRYYSVRYACVHGGQKFGRRGCGARHKQSMRIDCPAHITLRASKCGDHLEVIAACNMHNHACTESKARALPQNRRLSATARAEVVEMLQLRIDPKAILEYVHRTTGKLMTTKDMTNLRRTMTMTTTTAGVAATVAEGEDDADENEKENVDELLVEDERRSELLARIEAEDSTATMSTTTTSQNETTTTSTGDVIMDIVIVQQPDQIACTAEPPPTTFASLTAELPPVSTDLLGEWCYEVVDEDNLIEYVFQSASDDDEPPNNLDAQTRPSTSSLGHLESIQLTDGCVACTTEEYLLSPAYDEIAPTPDICSTDIATCCDSIVEFEEPTSESPANVVVASSSSSSSNPTIVASKQAKRYRVVRPTPARRPQHPQRPRRTATDALLRAQIAVLRAEKQKLAEETQILRLTKQQLLAEAMVIAERPESSNGGILNE